MPPQAERDYSPERLRFWIWDPELKHEKEERTVEWVRRQIADRKPSITCLALLLLVASLAGCGGIGRFDVVVTLDKEGFKGELGTIPSVEINLIGVNQVEYPEWSAKSMTAYWEPDHPPRITMVRKGYAHVMTFGEEQPIRQVLYRSHSIWNEWEAKGSAHLLVLSNYPRVCKDQAGNADPRRNILPLEKKRWKGYFWGKRVLWLEVTPSGLICHTPPKPQ